MPNQLPLGGAFRDGDIQIRSGDLGNGFDDHGQKRDEASNKEEANFLRFIQAEPGKRERNKHNNRHVSTNQSQGPEKGSDARKCGHVNAQGKRHDRSQRKTRCDPNEGNEGTPNQALIKVQRGKGLQNLARARQNQRRKHALLYRFTACGKPPREEEQGDETDRQSEGFRLSEGVPHSHLREAHDQGQNDNEGERENEKLKHYSFSNGNTFTSTRRFFLLCSGLLAS